jgi:hypothetical protein
MSNKELENIGSKADTLHFIQLLGLVFNNATRCI